MESTRRLILPLVTLSLLLCYITAHQVNIGLYSTGVDSDGEVVKAPPRHPDSPADLHWDIFSVSTSLPSLPTHSPGAVPEKLVRQGLSYRGEKFPYPAYVVAVPQGYHSRAQPIGWSSVYGHNLPEASDYTRGPGAIRPVNSPFIRGTETPATWISYIPEVNGYVPGGVYSFSTRFNLSRGADLRTVKIEMNIAADDNVMRVDLNGGDLGLVNSFARIGSQGLTRLKIDGVYLPLNTSFKWGENVLTIHVMNAKKTPMALLVQFVSATVNDAGGWAEYYIKHFYDHSTKLEQVDEQTVTFNYAVDDDVTEVTTEVSVPKIRNPGKNNTPKKIKSRELLYYTPTNQTDCSCHRCDAPYTLLDRTKPLPNGYQDLTTFGLPGIVLSPDGKLVLLDPPISENAASLRDVVGIQGVTLAYYGEPLCVTIVDAGRSGATTVTADVYNVARNETFGPFDLSAVCSNPGVFFGCINTVFGQDTQPTSSFTQAQTPFLVGEFGDELLVQYQSSLINSTTGTNEVFSTPVFLTCNQTRFWNFTFISTLLLQEKLETNRVRLQRLLQQLNTLNYDLFGNLEFGDDRVSRCELIGRGTDLAPISVQSFNFLDCLEARSEDAATFLSFLQQIESEGYYYYF